MCLHNAHVLGRASSALQVVNSPIIKFYGRKEKGEEDDEEGKALFEEAPITRCSPRGESQNASVSEAFFIMSARGTMRSLWVF